MKPEKAIEILETELPAYLSNPETDLMKAIKLGQEALKEVERLRRVEEFDPTIMLPGETTK